MLVQYAGKQIAFEDVLMRAGETNMSEDIEVKARPQETDWFSQGEDQGIAVAIWDDSITLQKKKKVGDEWQVIWKVSLSNSILERMCVRIPKWFEMTKKKRGE